MDALWVCELCVPVCRRVLRAGGRQGAAGAEAGALRRAALPARRLLPRPAGECRAAASDRRFASVTTGYSSVY